MRRLCLMYESTDNTTHVRVTLQVTKEYFLNSPCHLQGPSKLTVYNNNNTHHHLLRQRQHKYKHNKHKK